MYAARDGPLDETIRVLKSAVQKAKLGNTEEMHALRRLDDQARALERTAKTQTGNAIYTNGGMQECKIPENKCTINQAPAPLT